MAMDHDIQFVRGLTLQEALEMAYIDDTSEIFIEPPEPSVLTDEDSADEDDGGTLDNLSGRQLRSHVELKLSNATRITSLQDSLPEQEDKDEDVEGEDAGETDEDEVPVTVAVATDNGNTPDRPNVDVSKKIGLGDKINWSQNCDLTESNSKHFPQPSYAQFRGLSCVEIFEKCLDDEVIDLLVRKTRNYAAFKNTLDPKITADEIRSFIAILIVTGYDQKPGKRFYWDCGSDFKNILISNAMRRDRFIQIMKFIHCADNTKIDQSDKLYKLRPFMNLLKTRFQQNFVPVNTLDYDESMIRYYGRHGCKQFIRGKPIRFGFKMWALNTSDGYLLNCDMYQGKSPNANEQYELLFGKCTAPFVSMVDEIPHPEYPYRFYLDHLFTGINLLDHTRERGYGCTGTVRDNRIPKNCPLPPKKLMQKRDRGVHVSAIDKDHGIIFVKWADNNVVTPASTCHGVNPIGHVRRYSKTEKKFVQVPRPNIIAEYNNNMGGTDLMDEFVSNYRIGIRSKKWWWCIFTYLLDVTVSNFWIIYKKANGSKIAQLDFRRSITQTYLKRFENLPKGSGRPSTSKSSLSFNRISDDLRYDGRDHLSTTISDKKRRRCAGEGCTTSTRTKCTKCDVGLCIECNVIFHTNTM